MSQPFPYQSIDLLLQALHPTRVLFEERKKLQEPFNVFTALYKRHNEVKLHSRFLSVLLNPKGSHGKGSVFLQLFLEQLKEEIPEFDGSLGDLEYLEVYPTEADKIEYKNIDLLLINRSEKRALFIENKIWAGDSNHEDRGQLEGYYNLLLREGIAKDSLFCAYLSPEGREPSEESVGRYGYMKNMQGTTLSYGTFIQDWLETCLPHTVSSPFLRETLLQYLQLIKEMTNNNSDIPHLLAIKETIGKSAETADGPTRLLIIRVLSLPKASARCIFPP